MWHSWREGGGERRSVRVLVEKLREIDHLENLGVDEG